MSAAVLWLGVAAFAGALAVGVYLTSAIGWPVLAFAVLGGAGGDLLRGAADPLGLPRPRRDRHRTVVRPLDGARQPLPADTRAVLGRAVGLAGPGPADHGAGGGQRHSGLSSGPAGRQAQPGGAAGPAAGGVALSGARRRGSGGGCAGVSRAEFPRPAWRRCSPCRCSSPARAGRRYLRIAATVRAGHPQHRGLLLLAVSLFTAGVLSSLALAAPIAAYRIDTSARRCCLVAAHARLRSVLPALLHRIGPGKRTARRARRCGSVRLADQIIRPGAVRHAVRGEPLHRAAFLRLSPRRSAGRRAAEDRNQRPALRRRGRRAPGAAAGALRPDQPGRRHEEVYRASGPAARWKGACRLPCGPRRRPAARSDLRADPAQYPSGEAVIERAAGARRVSLQHREADAHRHGGASVGASSSRARSSTALSGDAGRSRAGSRGATRNFATAHSRLRKRCAASLRIRRRRCWCCRMAG